MTPGAPQPTPGLRLLVVDDEAQILELLDLTLTMRGYHVLTACGGPEALDLAAREGVDVLVLDVLMTPWDGFETLRRLAAQRGGPLPPTVFLSGLEPPDELPVAGLQVRSEYIVKPFRPAELVAAIERLWRA